MENKIDLRVRRTKKLIGGAFIELMQEKGFEEITVKDIADRAFINRNTFYLHYRDKNDLLKAVCADCLENWRRIITQPRSGNEDQHFRPLIVDTLQEISQKRMFYRTMMDSSGTTYFIDQLKKEIAAQMLEIIGERAPGFQTMFCIEYIVNGFLGAVRFALEQDKEFDADKMSQMVFQAVFDNATKLLDGRAAW